MTSGGFAALFFMLAAQADAAPRTREAGARVQHPRISALVGHTCAVLDDGTTRCWGFNESGQIGNGTVSSQSSPVSPSNLFGVVAIAAGDQHTCALALGGALGASVLCWGDNQVGQLGDGAAPNDHTMPAVVPGLDKVVAIAAGGSHTCAVRVDGTVRCWGFNNSGQLGDGTNSQRNVPVTVREANGSPLSGVVGISAGENHTCARLVNGQARCWGSNIWGTLGDGTSTPLTRTSPVAVKDPAGTNLAGVMGISAGDMHTCAVLVDGSARCWGRNAEGQIGDTTTSTTRRFATPVQQAVGQVLNNATAIAVGDYHTCAVRSDGTVSCWGRNADGQLGDSGTAPRFDAGGSVVGVNNVVEVAAGEGYSCALDAAGVARCWGSNNRGKLGNQNAADPSLIAVTVDGVAGSIGARGIAAGSALSCARRGNGAASCWGANDGGLGDGGGLPNPPNVFSPGPVNVSGLSNVVALAAGLQHACALQASGESSCWGYNAFGQLGNDRTVDSSSPVRVVNIQNAVSISTGWDHSCAVLVDGTARCWGHNLAGQLGDGTRSPSDTPVQVAGLNNVVAIAGGRDHTCALIADGTVRCWGSNGRGQLGVGPNPTRSFDPLPVVGLANVLAISASGDHTCALLVSGGVMCWGKNDAGQLGNNTTQDRTIPDPVLGLSDAVGIAAGDDHTCASRATGVASCWGANAEGQLAAEDSEDHLIPTPVIRNFTTARGITFANPLGSVFAIVPSPDGFLGHTCAVQATGQPQCWGSNSHAQVGIAPPPDSQPRPVAVPSFTANVRPAVTLRSNGRIAEVTALVNCEVGDQAQVFVSLAQGQISGSGVGSERCTGGLAEIPVVVPAQGQTRFQSGEAIASLEAIVRDKGEIPEHQFWTRRVVLATP